MKPLQITALSYVVDSAGDVTKELFTPTRVGSLASARLQLLPALKAAQSMELKMNVLSLHAKKPGTFDLLQTSNICLLGKLSANSNERVQDMIIANLAAVTRLKNMGAKIVVQYSDNVFATKNKISSFYHDIMKLSDYVVYPSLSLQNLTAEHIRPEAKTLIIPDPWQIKKPWTPRKLNLEKVKILWYGSNKNIDYLLKCLPGILRRSYKANHFELTILGQIYALEKAKTILKSCSQTANHWHIRMVPWRNDLQPQQLESEISNSNIAIIPSDPLDPLKAGVSHNRLVDGLRGGCICIASPMDSYKELESIAILGDDMGENLAQAINNYEKYYSLIKTKRDTELLPFSPKQNHANWINFWSNILDIK